MSAANPGLQLDFAAGAGSLRGSRIRHRRIIFEEAV
jgi:hypothetical protein